MPKSLLTLIFSVSSFALVTPRPRPELNSIGVGNRAIPVLERLCIASIPWCGAGGQDPRTGGWLSGEVQGVGGARMRTPIHASSRTVAEMLEP
jgi:hypothetical protein